MDAYVNGKKYLVIVKRKNNKNTYIRVKEDLCIHVTTSYFTNENSIKKLIKENEDVIEKMFKRIEKRIEKKKHFYFLGKKYDIVFCNILKEPEFLENVVYVKDLNSLNKYVKKYTEKLFKERFLYNFEKFDGRIAKPTLNIRKMTRKWGHCNKKECAITINSDLIKYNVDDLDYVIIHELCHLLVFNHSELFWQEVKRYKPDYKTNRKALREE